MRPFRIVTHKNWLAKSFPGAVQDFGFDIDPSTAMETLWWAPGAWVASAQKVGVELPLMSCGPTWLDAVPYELRGRPVITMELQRLTDDEPVPSFVKLPEAKVEACPARVYNTPLLKTTWEQYSFPADTLVQVQGVVEFVIEARFFIAHGEIVGESFYRINDLVWGEEDFAALAEAGTVLHWRRGLWDLAGRVIAEVPAPPGFVLDVGLCADGRPLIIEANAAWSSGPYDCDPAGVVKAIEAAHDFNGEYPQWAWQPNPVFDKVGPLRIVAS